MSIVTFEPHIVNVEPLTSEGFLPFGDVAARPSGSRRRYLPTSADCADDARTFSFWISSAAKVGQLPLSLTTLERHPFSAQTFVPLDAGKYLAIVCEARDDGLPDLATVRAFLAGGHQSVTFARNVWHHPMTVLGHAMEFAVAMGMTGRQDDDVFVSLDGNVRVVMPANS
jgi:ureidoglycolate lyase